MRLAALLFIWSLLAAANVSGAGAAERVALVIGNSAYEHVPRLPNTTNDASDMAASLERLGFSVRRATDLPSEGMRRALRDFGGEAATAEMAVVFFAGHGLEVDHQNYLIPVDAHLSTDRDILYEAIPLDLVMASVEEARALKLIMLDSCRNNPFAASMQLTSATRSIGRGLSRVDPAVGTLVGFAAKEGTTAEDGDGRNSPYTSALLRHIEEPGLEIQFLFRKVRDSVLEATNGNQEPFTYGSLPGQAIYLKEPQAVEAPPMAVPAPAAEAEDADGEAAVQADIVRRTEEALWNIVKDSEDAATLERFLTQYSDGVFATTARERLRVLADRSAAEPEVVAAADPNATIEVPAEPQLAGPELAKAIQEELQRVGCSPGSPDGIWGRRSVRALEAFAERAGVTLANLDPSGEILEQLRARTDRVCALACSVREVERDGRCVRKTCPSGQALTSRGACVAASPPDEAPVANVAPAEQPNADPAERPSAAAASPPASSQGSAAVDPAAPSWARPGRFVACDPDAQRFCGSDNTQASAGCMVANLERLQPACRAIVKRLTGR